MNVEQVGRGPDVVVLHSLLTDCSAFRYVLPRLQAGRRVTLVNLPGYGGTPPSHDRIEDVADRIAKHLPSVGVVPGFDVIGNGYGGFIALSLAQQQTASIGRLVLMDTAAYFPPPGKAALATLREAVKMGGMAAVVDIAIRRLFPESFIQATPKVVDECRKVLLSLNSDGFAVTCRNLIDTDLRKDLEQVSNPTLVIVGTEDAATPPALARVLAEGIHRARLIEIPGCGHAPHIQMPGLLCDILDGFLTLTAESA